MQPTQRYDVLVVGARCAGAATAMLLAQRGLRVLAIDRGVYEEDTISTHALMRAGVLQLHRWGASAPLAGTRHATGALHDFHYGAKSTPKLPFVQPMAWTHFTRRGGWCLTPCSWTRPVRLAPTCGTATGWQR